MTDFAANDEFLEWASKQENLANGEMIIQGAKLTSLEETLEHLLHRAKYYDELPDKRMTYVEQLEELLARVQGIRRGAE